MTRRSGATAFQRRFVRDFKDNDLDPATRAVLEEIAVRLNSSSIWPPGIAKEIAITIANVLTEAAAAAKLVPANTLAVEDDSD